MIQLFLNILSNMGHICKIFEKDGLLFPTHSFTNSSKTKNIRDYVRISILEGDGAISNRLSVSHSLLCF